MKILLRRFYLVIPLIFFLTFMLQAKSYASSQPCIGNEAPLNERDQVQPYIWICGDSNGPFTIKKKCTNHYIKKTVQTTTHYLQCTWWTNNKCLAILDNTECTIKEKDQ